MTLLNHLVEPERLLMTWQPLEEGNSSRTRRVIGEILPSEERGKATFRYFPGSPDYLAAERAGFQGFPAFKLGDAIVSAGVLEALLRRLPPRTREDFREYLAQFGLPSPFPLSDFALLGYTGAKLPSDGFSLVPEFGGDAVPCDFIMEVAGTRHVGIDTLHGIEVGDELALRLEQDNPVDTDAIAVYHGSQKVGYVNRALRQTIHRWVGVHHVAVTVARKNGKPGRPLLFARVSASA